MSALQCLLRPLLVLMFLALSGSITVPVHAQVSVAENPLQGTTPGGVNDGASSDSELWRKIRKGQPGTVVGGDKSSGLMIQSGGQDWRLIRNGPLPRYAAWAILGTLLLLALFFALRGRIKIDHGPSGKTMKRFSAIERAGHWLLASSFIVLALTGLNLLFGKTLLLPLFGKEFFASVTVFGKYIHNYVGFAFMLGLAMIAVMWVVHNIPNLNDLKWLLRGGGIIGGGHPPAKKFNAGQKIIFWIVIFCGVSISLSGWALMNPFTTEMFSSTFSLSNSIFGTSFATDLAPIQEQQYQSLWHTIMAVFMIVVILAHIYIGSIGMEGALSAMTTGDVDTNWAREHHSLWVEEEEVKSGTVPSLSGETAVAAATTVAAAPAAKVMVAPSDTPSNTAPSPLKMPAQSAALDARPKPAKVAVVEPKVTAKAVPKSTGARKKTVKPKAPVKSDKSAAQASAAEKPASRKSTTRQSARSKDDLKLIKGIGPQNEQRLNKIGVKLFDDIAKWSKKEQADIGQRLAFPGRIEREEWVKQAKALAKKETKG